MRETASADEAPPWVDVASLTASVPPGGMPERDAVRERLRATLQGPLDGGGSTATVLYGPPGTGKTALLRSLTDAAVPAEGTVCWLSGTPRTSVYTLAAQVARHFGETVPDSGLALETVRTRALDAAAGRSGPLVVVLDDVDAVPADVRRSFVTDVVAELRGPGVAVVAVADVAFRNDLDAVEKSLLCDRELAVGPYDERQLRTILERRVDAAVDDGALDDAVIDRLTTYAAADGHTLGDALALLAIAGENADADGRTTLDVADLDAAMEHLPVRRIEAALESLRDHERLALRGLAALDREGELPTRVGQAYGAYVDACEAAAVDPNTERSLQNYLRSLTDTDLVASEQVRTDRGGQYYRYDLLVDGDLLLAALEGETVAERDASGPTGER